MGWGTGRGLEGLLSNYRRFLGVPLTVEIGDVSLTPDFTGAGVPPNSEGLNEGVIIPRPVQKSCWAAVLG